MATKVKKVKDISVGDTLKIAGTTVRVRGVTENEMNGIVLELRRKDVKIPQQARSRKQAQKRLQARRAARMTLVVSKNRTLNVLSK